MAEDPKDKLKNAVVAKTVDPVTPTQTAISKLPVFLAGAGLGLLAAYVLDPEHGEKRREQIKTQSDHGWRTILRKVAAALHDFTHRSAPSVPGETLKKVKDTVEDTLPH